MLTAKSIPDRRIYFANRQKMEKEKCNLLDLGLLDYPFAHFSSDQKMIRGKVVQNDNIFFPLGFRNSFWGLAFLPKPEKPAEPIFDIIFGFIIPDFGLELSPSGTHTSENIQPPVFEI